MNEFRELMSSEQYIRFLALQIAASSSGTNTETKYILAKAVIMAYYINTGSFPLT